jgi:pectate lyase
VQPALLLVCSLSYACGDSPTHNERSPAGALDGDDDDTDDDADDIADAADDEGAGLDSGKVSQARPGLDGGTRPGTGNDRVDAAKPGATSDAGADTDADVVVHDASQSEVDETPVSPSDCPTTLEGFAGIVGDGVSTTTGGGSAAPVRPKTAAELLAFASDETPRVIEIAGSFDVPALLVSSNKTLLGIGKDATLRGGVKIRGHKDEAVRNIILRNLRVDGATTQVDDDAVQLQFAHHVLIDHCEIFDGPDGSLDMTHAVNWVTVQWTKVHYTSNYKKPEGEPNDHRFASLIGHSDNNESEDKGRLKISFHHNWWGERVIERMPRVRFGQVHVFNNYFAAPSNNYCVRAGIGASVLIEGNYFDHVNSPHEFNSEDDQKTAHITARDNQYDGVTGNQLTGGGGTPLTSVPYQAKIEPAAEVPALVKGCAGPR